LHLVLEAVGLVVDHPRRAEAEHEALVVARAGGDHLGAAGASELDGEVADAPGRAVDEDDLALLQPALVEQALPGGQGRQPPGAPGPPAARPPPPRRPAARASARSGTPAR